MVRFGKKAAVLTAAGVLAAMTVTGCSSTVDSDKVVATVGGEEITMGVAGFYARMTQGQYETYYAQMMGMTAADMWSQAADEEQTYEEYLKDSILESVENLYLISQHASEYDVSLTEDERKAITDTAEQFDADNTEDAKEYAYGYQKDIEKYLELVTIQNKMDSKMREGVDEEVSDEEAAQKGMQYVFFSYTATDDSGSSAELTDEEKEALKTTAQNLADRVRNGEDISAVATELGYQASDATFDSESTTPNSDLIAAADALEAEGDVTDPVETDSGIYVARLTTLLDREATDQEKETIVEQRRQDQYDSLLEEWRSAAEISVNESVWNKLDFEDLGITIITSEEEDRSESSGEESTEDGTADTSGTAEDSTADGTEDASGTAEDGTE